MSGNEKGESLENLAVKLSRLADELMQTGETMSPADIRSLSTALVNIGKLQTDKTDTDSPEIRVVFVGNDWDVR